MARVSFDPFHNLNKAMHEIAGVVYYESLPCDGDS